MNSRAATAVKGWATKKIWGWLIGLFGITNLLVLLFLLIVVLMMVGAAQTTDTSSSSVSSENISPEVEKYRSVVTQYCQQDGIPNMVDAILAIMMQESGGTGNDVMQSSESLGSPPDSLSPEDSIRAGVAAFARNYKTAQEVKHNQFETALQGYNFGNGYVSWAIKRDGGYTKENAVEFARIHSHGQKRIIGAQGKYVWAYGDQDYVDHVERYLTVNDGKGSLPSLGAQAETAISQGEKLIGHTTYVFGGGRSESDIKAGRFDCSSFVHYAFAKAGINVGWTTDQLVSEGQRIPANEAKRGDLVFFDTYKKNGHVGILLGNGQFLACNTSNGVEISSLSNSYWKSVYHGVIVRVVK